MKIDGVSFTGTEILIHFIGTMSFWGLIILMTVWIYMNTKTIPSLANPPKGNEKTYIYDVDFYETVTITEKETL